MNQIMLYGRLAADPDTRTAQSGKTLANFRLAVNNGKNDADFFNCTAFEKTGELISGSCRKGHRLVIWGRLTIDKWNDAQTGVERTAPKIIVNGFSFVETLADTGGQQSTPPQQQYSQPPMPPAQPPQYQQPYQPPMQPPYPPQQQQYAPPAQPPAQSYAQPPVQQQYAPQQPPVQPYNQQQTVNFRPEDLPF